MRAALQRVVTQMWETVLGVQIDAIEAGPRPLDLTALIHIRGAWNGTLLIGCSLDLGQELAARLYGLAPDEVSEADIHDLLGELANIAAGNIKAELPRFSGLSLPTVLNDGTEEAQSSGETLCALSFRSLGEPTWVELRSAAGASA